MTDPGYIAAGFAITSAAVVVYTWSLRSRLVHARRAVDDEARPSDRDALR